MRRGKIYWSMRVMMDSIIVVISSILAVKFLMDKNLIIALILTIVSLLNIIAIILLVRRIKEMSNR